MKNNGGNTMSLKTRLGLLAGTSFAAAMLASTPAFAANECGDPGANGGAADSLTCATPPTYATGVDYSTTSNGDLTVILQNRFDTGTAGTGGIRMFGKTGEDMTLIREDDPAGAGDPRIVNTAGRAIDITTLGDGNVSINLTDGDPTAETNTTINTGNAPIRITGSTDAIRAEAQGTGAVSVIFAETGLTSTSGTDHRAAAIASGAGGSVIVAGSTTGDIEIDTRGASLSINNASGVSAIDAVSTSGDITINTGAVNGRLRGMLVQTGGAGAINVTTTGRVFANATAGLVGIDLIAGTGGVNVTFAANPNPSLLNTVSGGTGPAIRAAAASLVNIQNTGAVVQGWVDFSGVTAGGVVFTNDGSTNGNGIWAATGASVFSSQADTLTFAGVTTQSNLAAGASISFGGGADTLNVLREFSAAGTVDFGTGADILNVAGTFRPTGAVNFGSGADTLNLDGIIIADGALLNFGADTDTLEQDGGLFAGGATTIDNLESFNNRAGIYLGGDVNAFGDYVTDLATNDLLTVSSGTFTGSDGSVIIMDANLGLHGSQVGCAALTVSDCVNFTGATTAGSTLVRVKDIAFAFNGGTLGAVVTLIEGSTAAEHFTLDPASDYYAETALGGAVRKPVVAYYFVYDEANQRHVLVGAPTDEPFQVGTFAAAAQETWRATSGSWLTRQADLRATPGGLDASRGVWGRISGQSGEREATTSYSTGGVSLDYDLSHKQRIAHLDFGADVIGGPGWVLGATVGFVRSDVEFEATPTEATLTGFSGGLYASYVAGPLFVDGLFNANILHVKADAPAMGLGLDVPMKFDLKSLGGQVEAGWRIPLGGAFVEPLAGVSYVETMVDDADVPGGAGAFTFEKSRSIRYGAGARVGMDSELMGMSASYSLTGRYWNETQGESSATITTASGSSAELVDEFVGDFSEVVASLNLYSGDGGVSGFVNLGGKFGDDYQAADGSIGVRVRW